MVWSFALIDQIRRLLAEVRRPRALDESAQRALVDMAEPHGLAGTLLEVWRDAGFPVFDSQPHDVRRIARELDHAAHLSWLRTLGRGLEAAGIRAVVLKGALLAERLYAHPATRATTDVDLLVGPEDLDRAVRVLEALGYVGRTDAREERFRREHHHLHFLHREALPVELHFHAFSSFGNVLPGPPLLARRRPAPAAMPTSLGVLSPEDELLFLIVHGAAHRFVRAGWTFDVVRLLDRMPLAEVARTAANARELGFGRPLAFGARFLELVSDVEADKLAALGRIGLARRGAVALVGEPRVPVVRSATRLVYTVALCDTSRAAVTYAWRATRDHARRLAGHEV